MTRDKTKNKIDAKKLNKAQSNDAQVVLNIIQKKTFKFIFVFVLICLLVILIASVLNHIPCGNNECHKNIFQELAETINIFVSIILGIIATMMSIISLFFSFYNTKQSYDTHDEYLEKFIHINHSLEKTVEKQEDNLNELRRIDERIHNSIENTDKKIEEKFRDMTSQFDTLTKNLDRNNITTQEPEEDFIWVDNDDNWE